MLRAAIRQNGEPTLSKFLQLLIFLCAGVLIFSSAAIWNGYPLVYHDSFEYISGRASVLSQAPVSYHPIVYSLLVEVLVSIFGSLWAVVGFHSLILSFCLWIALDSAGFWINGIALRLLALFVIAIPLSATWIQSTILADGLTSPAVLSFILLNITPKLKRWESWLLVAILALACASHYSHIVLIALLWSAFLCGTEFRRSCSRKYGRLGLSALAIGLSVFFILASTCYEKSARNLAVVPSYHIFLLGRIAETGVLWRLLDERCDSRDYIFCSYRHNPIDDAGDLIWSLSGPIRQTLGPGNHPEYALMIRDSIRFYPFQFIVQNIRSVMRLLVRFRIGPWLVEVGKNPAVLRERVPAELPFYLNARQQTQSLSFYWENICLYSFVAGAFVMALHLFCISHGRGLTPYARELVLMGFLAIVLNAFVCGSLSAVRDRYQARVVWMLPAFLLLGVGESFRRPRSSA